MSLQLEREIEKLKLGIISIGAEVEKQLRLAVESADRKNLEVAESVIENDSTIDKMEVDLEEECLKVLALHQPVARDLRFIVAVLKINNDLERIGDLSTSIAKRAQSLSKGEHLPFPFDFDTMEQKTRLMLKQALDALTGLDAKLAQNVCKEDDIIDEIYRDMYEHAADEMKLHPENIDNIISMMGIARQLERIADLVTNIAEDIIYMIEGRIVRHGLGETNYEL